MNSPPTSWAPDWQAALVNATLGIICYREGLTGKEFATLAGVSVGVVHEHAKAGLAHFQTRFGEQCSFRKVHDSKFQIARLVFTFGGVIRPAASKPPLPGLLSLPQFCEQQQVKDWLVRREVRRGHAAFRRHFPEWDFLEQTYPFSNWTARWFGRIEDIGEQPDAPPDETALTIYKLAHLVGVHYQTVRRFRDQGLERFEQRFPGWSFRQEGRTFVYCRKVEEFPHAP
ncbi:hypothetical protein [Halomicronema sp. CCY15110]|uniref:hypothetical protein n=1 Tax=Halomicronema sp. CCY15110 TaxID=2767773 RepID=UPI00195063BB|nr:hypothetical protein [Halomicronema sp. CCY15110]